MTPIDKSLVISNIYSLRKGSELNFEENIDYLESLKNIFSAEELISSILSFCLTSKETKVLSSRHGISSSTVVTLEMLGKHFKVTRERIRQIQAKAERKLRHPSKSIYLFAILNTLLPDLNKNLFGNSGMIFKSHSKEIFKLLSNVDRFLITMCYGNFNEFLNRNSRMIDDVWMKEITLSKEEFQNSKDKQSRNSFNGYIKIEQDSCFWPITLREISSRTHLSKYLLERHYSQNKSFVIEGDLVKVTKLRETQKVVYILRESQSPLNINQVYERYRELFSKNVKLRNVAAALGHSNEVTLYERGTYCLDEQISINETLLVDIKDRVHQFLIERNEYCSSKYIHKELFKERSNYYNHQLTYYVLHSLLQKDGRFIVKRGLMIGLKDKKFSGTFSSLSDEVYQIIESKGPISEVKIIEALSSRRDVFTINNIINDDDRLCSIQYPLEMVKFDLVERVIGDEATQEKLFDAIQLNLARSPLSPSELLKRLMSVGFEQNPRAIFHLAKNHENVEALFELKSLSLFKLLNPKKFDTYLNDNSISEYLFNLDSYKENIFLDNSLDESLISSLLWED